MKSKNEVIESMKKVLGLFALLLIIVAGIFFAQNYLKTRTIFPFIKSPKALINNHTFQLTVARSPEEKEVGLSKATSLSENQGMIFLFEKPDYYSFWMKDMKLPIDIIYINKDEIVTIQNNVQPPKSKEENPIIYAPTQPSDKVLEISGGLSEKYNFKKGDKVKYENLGN